MKFFWMCIGIGLSTFSIIGVWIASRTNQPETIQKIQLVTEEKPPLASPSLISTSTPTITPSPYPLITLNESSSPEKSANKEWWVSSGGKAFIQGQTIKTIQGSLPSSDQWYTLYNNSNPLDTDAGKHPQNIFRLVHKQKVTNYSQEVYFSINTFNESESENRNESNGVLLFNRYQDENNLYYTGIRVDGQAVIKKKSDGNYETLAIKKILSGSYSRNTELLRIHTFYGIKSTVKTNENGVTITLFTDLYNSGSWKKVLEIIDSHPDAATTYLSGPGYTGLRSDFMDVEFKNYNIQE